MQQRKAPIGTYIIGGITVRVAKPYVHSGGEPSSATPTPSKKAYVRRHRARRSSSVGTTATSAKRGPRKVKDPQLDRILASEDHDMLDKSNTSSSVFDARILLRAHMPRGLRHASLYELVSEWAHNVGPMTAATQLLRAQVHLMSERCAWDPRITKYVLDNLVGTAVGTPRVWGYASNDSRSRVTAWLLGVQAAGC